MAGDLADLGQHLPAAFAFVAFGQLRYHRNTAGILAAERLRRPLALTQRDAGGDADFGEVEVEHRRTIVCRCIDHWMRLQAGTAPLLGALEFQRAGAGTADTADLIPSLAQRSEERTHALQPPMRLSSAVLSLHNTTQPTSPHI